MVKATFPAWKKTRVPEKNNPKFICSFHSIYMSLASLDWLNLKYGKNLPALQWETKNELAMALGHLCSWEHSTYIGQIMQVSFCVGFSFLFLLVDTRPIQSKITEKT